MGSWCVGQGAELSYRTAEPGLAVQVSAPEDDSDVLIELKDVWKSFGSNDILRGCNMKIRRGEAVGIIGGSGTGKSTTLRIMAGLLAPDRVRAWPLVPAVIEFTPACVRLAMRCQIIDWLGKHISRAVDTNCGAVCPCICDGR